MFLWVYTYFDDIFFISPLLSLQITRVLKIKQDQLWNQKQTIAWNSSLQIAQDIKKKWTNNNYGVISLILIDFKFAAIAKSLYFCLTVISVLIPNFLDQSELFTKTLRQNTFKKSAVSIGAYDPATLPPHLKSIIFRVQESVLLHAVTKICLVPLHSCHRVARMVC
jgi:hypothetical protein